MIDVKL